MCGVAVGAQVLTILSGIAQDTDTVCTSDNGDQTVTVFQAGG